MIDGLPDVHESVVFDSIVPIEELVERDGLKELCQSFHALFGIGVRVYSVDGALLAASAADQDLCVEIGASAAGHRACTGTMPGWSATTPGPRQEIVMPCFTGAAYYVAAIEYDGRRVGRMIVGPYVPVQTTAPPATMAEAVPAFDAARASALLAKMPHAKPETIRRIGGHLKSALDLILFSGHKAHMTSKMHLASVRESYRELADKTQRLQEAFDRLKELDQLKSQFLATVSHELRTPLTSIIGYSEMLVQGLVGEMQPDQLEFVRTIHDKGEQLVKLIMGLLDLGKLESGTMRVVMRPTHIEPILAEVASTMMPAAKKKGVRLDVALEGAFELPEIQGDSDRLRQVFLNLVENAIKFTAPGGSVTLRRHGVDGGPGERGSAGGRTVGARPDNRANRGPRGGHRHGDPGSRAASRLRCVLPGRFVEHSGARRDRTRSGDCETSRGRAWGIGAHRGWTSPMGTVFVVSLPQAGSSGHR